MTFLVSLIKSLPFLLPFFKEVFLSDKEGKSKYCVRIYVLGILSFIGVGLVGNSFYQYIFNIHAENQVLKLELNKAGDFQKHLIDSSDAMRVRNKRQYQAYLLLTKSYEDLRGDYKDLKFEYDKLFRFVLERDKKLTDQQADLLKKDHEKATAEFEKNSKIIIDATIFSDLEQPDIPVTPPPVNHHNIGK